MSKPRKVKKISDTSKAVAWMLADPNRTQVDAANMFGISQSGISSMRAREDFAIHYCEKVPDIVERVHLLLAADPTRSPKGIAYSVGIKESEARLVMLGLRTKTARDEARRGMLDEPDPVDAMREKCAKIAEMIGGDHGASVALAIRGIQ